VELNGWRWNRRTTK